MATKKYINLENLSTFLSSLRETFSALGHKHTMSDIEDYTVDTELSSDSVNPVQNQVVTEAINTLSSTVAYIDSADNATVVTTEELEAIENGTY